MSIPALAVVVEQRPAPTLTLHTNSNFASFIQTSTAADRWPRVRTSDGALIFCSAIGRPVLLQRTAESLRTRLREFLSTESVEIGLQIRRIRDQHRQGRIEELALAVERNQFDVDETLRYLASQAATTPLAISRWNLNSGMSMDLFEFLRNMRDQESKQLIAATRDWVRIYQPEQRFNVSQSIVVPSCYGFASASISDAIQPLGIYRVRPAADSAACCKGAFSDVNFEDALDPSCEEALIRLRIAVQ